MTYPDRNLLGSALVFMGLCLWGADGLADGRTEVPHVLVINSYHPQYQWTARLVEGIQDALAGVIPEEHLHIEYMDGRRFVDDHEYQEQLSALYRHKYADFKPSLIISSDDYAFNYLLEVRDDLFPGTPVVFCGVNVFEPELLRGRRGFTGILEGMEIEGNLALIQEVQPDVERIIMLADRTSFGLRMGDYAREVMAAYAAAPSAVQPRLELWDDYTLPQLYDDASRLEDDTALLLLAIHKDSAGDYFSFSGQLPLLSERSAVPIYGMWGALLLGNGVLGGALNDPYLHGQNAAGIAARILAGEDVDSIPIVPKAVFKPAFDYQQLQRFGLSEGDLPAGARVEFRPVTLYSQYRSVVWLTVLLFAGLVGVIANLTVNIARRRRAEESLRASEQQLSLHVQSSSLGFIEWNHDLTVRSWNPAAEQIFGYTAQEAFGRPMSLLFPELTEADSQAWLNGEGRRRAAAEHRRADGERVRCEWFHTPLVSTTGAVIGLASLVEDVTERRLLEEQLVQSQKMEAVGRLAGGIAHDFNNILTVIMGNLELAVAALSPGARVTHQALTRLENVQKSSQRAVKLTRQLLVFSRQDVIRDEVVDARVILEQSRDMLARLIAEDIALNVTLADTPQLVRVDSGQLEQIIVNLVVNSAYAMPSGGALSLSVAPLPAPARAVRLTVGDSGSGMDEATMARACEPFFTTKPSSSGTGLGLSIVFGLVRQWGGELHIESEVGQGTRIHIDLPSVEAEGTEPEIQQLAPARGGSEVVLLAEDSPEINALITTVLNDAGYTVFSACDGSEALDLYARHPELDLLVTDVIMPKTGGRELAEHLQRQRPGLKVLFISGYTNDVLSSHGGVDDIQLLHKPFEPPALLRRVRALLDG